MGYYDYTSLEQTVNTVKYTAMWCAVIIDM